MSQEPNRFDVPTASHLRVHGPEMIFNPEGKYVEYADYAHLKSENEALRKELADAQENYHLVNEMVARLRKELQAENAFLKAEVERLNEAIIRGAIVPDAKPYDQTKNQG